MTDTAGARFDRLVDVMRTLRSPHGCPWDREQTLSSLRPFVLEETYELLDALDRGDLASLCEELGDFLYEAVFLAQRAIVFSRRPGRVVLDHRIDLPVERTGALRMSTEFEREAQALYETLRREEPL